LLYSYVVEFKLQLMAHHKIWESGKNPHCRPDKGKKKPQALRRAKRRLQNLKNKLRGQSTPSLF